MTVIAVSDPMMGLPEEILIQILSHLGVRDLCEAALVCRLWRETVNSPCLWRKANISLNTQSNKKYLALSEAQGVKIFVRLV